MTEKCHILASVTPLQSHVAIVDIDSTTDHGPIVEHRNVKSSYRGKQWDSEVVEQGKGGIDREVWPTGTACQALPQR